jgi:hypothetical protein
MRSDSDRLVIDMDTADRITVHCLKEQRAYLKKELAKFKKGEYLHPDDVVNNTQVIAALDTVIKHFGG